MDRVDSIDFDSQVWRSFNELQTLAGEPSTVRMDRSGFRVEWNELGNPHAPHGWFLWLAVSQKTYLPMSYRALRGSD